MNAVADFQVVSLLDVLLSVSTDLFNPCIQIDSSFDGQTCLVRGDEAALAETLRGLVENALRSSGCASRLAAAIQSTGRTVTLTLSERTGGAEWALQFPEVRP